VEPHLQVEGLSKRFGPFWAVRHVTFRLDAGEVGLCLHGAGGNGQQFDGVLAALHPAHSPLAFDQPGHHRSGGLDSLGSVERMATFTGALTDKLGLRPHALLGHGLGGAVALQRALDAPAAVRALVLVASAARFEVPDDTLALWRRVTEGKERRPFDPSRFAPGTPRELLQRGFMDGVKTDPRATYGDWQAAAACDLRDALPRVACPALVVTGEHEDAAERARAEALAEGLPAARLQVLAGAGHHVPLEQPEALAAAVADFAAELP